MGLANRNPVTDEAVSLQSGVTEVDSDGVSSISEPPQSKLVVCVVDNREIMAHFRETELFCGVSV